MIYLVSPYPHPDPAVRMARYRAACRATRKLEAAGLQVCSPIAHEHALVPYRVSSDWDSWASSQRAHIARCEEVMVLTTDGWDDDPIVQAVVEIAGDLGLPIRFLSQAVY